MLFCPCRAQGMDGTSLSDVGVAGFHAALYALVLATVSTSGFLDSVYTRDDDTGQVAVEAWQEVSSRLLNLPLQLDVFLCLLYIYMGVHFILRSRKFAQDHANACKEGDIYMSYVLDWMCIIDSISHLVYHCTLAKRALIMNQWYSVGISAWGTSFVRHLDSGWSVSRNLWYMRVSALSYGLAFLHPQGFSAVVALHVISAVFTVLTMLSTFERPPPPITKIFYKGLFCVILFFLFNYLKSILINTFIFKLISVHLMADICTCFLYYFAMQFFLTHFDMRAEELQQRATTVGRRTPARRRVSRHSL